MKNLKIIILFTLFFISINSTYSNNGYNYPYICNEQDCHNTDFWIINPRSNWYFLSNTEIIEVKNFKEYIDNIINSLSDDYNNQELTIKWKYEIREIEKTIVNEDFIYTINDLHNKTRRELEDIKKEYNIKFNFKNEIWYSRNDLDNKDRTQLTIIAEYYKIDVWLFTLTRTIINNILDAQNDEKSDIIDIIYNNENNKVILEEKTTEEKEVIEDIKITLNELLLIDNEIITKIEVESCDRRWRNCTTNIEDKIYGNWKKYFLENFTRSINELHNWLPLWTRKNQLSDFIDNFISYEDSKFELKNVCSDTGIFEDDNWLIICDNTEKQILNINNETNIFLVKWNIEHNRNFIRENFKVSDDYRISSRHLKAWDSLDFTFNFEDYLDVSSEKTKYEYRIYYRYEWESEPDIDNPWLTEVIEVDSNNYSINSETIEDNILNELINIDVLNNRFKHIQIQVSESITLTKTGRVYFYLYAKNHNTWDYFNIKKINNTPVHVIPNDNISNWRAESIIPDFNKEINLGNWYNRVDTFTITINLFDMYWNRHFDNIEWYDISLSDWSSEYIQLSQYSQANWNNWYITWVKSFQESPHTIQFHMRIPEPWYHIFKWFDITAREKIWVNAYRPGGNTNTLTEIIPINLYDWDQLMTFHIAMDTHVDFELDSCTNRSVTFSAICTSDNFSWCRWWFNDITIWSDTYKRRVIFEDESNNWESWTIIIADRANNIRWFNYSINHIDQTAPTITTTIAWITLQNWETYNYLANDNDLLINFYESTPSNCDAEVRYIIRVNNETKDNWVLIWHTVSKNFEWIFKSYWQKEVKIIAIDKYWNRNEVTYNFNIYPNFINNNLSLATPSEAKNTKSANWQDYYTYTLILKDQFWNPIYDREIESISHHCWNINWCDIIRSNMIWDNPTWNPTIDINFDNSIKTDENWKVTFTLKSIAPWTFSERFRVQLKDWDNEYNQNWDLKNYDIWSFDNKNWFKNIFKWNLKTSIDNWISWEANPIIGTDMLYRLNISRSYTSYTDFEISNNFKDYILPYDLWNTSVEINESSINWLNTMNPEFEARIYNHSDIQLWTPWIKLANNDWYSRLPISYKINWTEIRTYISGEYSHKINNSTYPVQIFWEEWLDWFLWVKVIWWLQWWGNSELTWQEANISDLSLADIRANIRTNAYSFINSANEWQISNEIVYFSWDKNISDINTSWVSSIIIKEWNLTIDRNIDNTIWIIVLSDWYDVNKWQNQKWNIFINSDITYIDAILYADGWVISTNNWNLYLNDSAQRTADLQNQLRIKGSLFTRNTIWWAEGWRVLPWWSIANDEFTAITYDLNYIRRWNDWCETETRFNTDDEPYEVCKIREATIIEYNPRVVSNPPKLFSR